MPTQTIWVEPELFLEHAGRKVFHTYKDNDMDEGRNRYCFTLNAECSCEENACGLDPCPHVFDVRTLPTWKPPVQPAYCIGPNDTPENRTAWDRYWEAEKVAMESAIRATIDGGQLPLTVSTSTPPEGH